MANTKALLLLGLVVLVMVSDVFGRELAEESAQTATVKEDGYGHGGGHYGGGGGGHYGGGGGHGGGHYGGGGGHGGGHYGGGGGHYGGGGHGGYGGGGGHGGYGGGHPDEVKN